MAFPAMSAKAAEWPVLLSGAFGRVCLSKSFRQARVLKVESVRKQSSSVDGSFQKQSFPPVVGTDFVQGTGDSSAGDQALGYKIVCPTPVVLPYIRTCSLLQNRRGRAQDRQLGGTSFSSLIRLEAVVYGYISYNVPSIGMLDRFFAFVFCKKTPSKARFREKRSESRVVVVFLILLLF